MTTLGVILAGGQSRRYGAPKALAHVGGEPILERVVRAMRQATDRVVMVANDAEPYADFDLETRPDARSGLGVLGGIETAVLWAEETGRDGALVVACDMPFLSVDLLRHLDALARTPEPDGTAADIVTPESEGPRGVEPLCSWYGVGCRAAIAAQARREERRIIGFWHDVRVRRVPLAEVRGYGDPALLFMNVNTPAERERAEALAAGADLSPPRGAADPGAGA